MYTKLVSFKLPSAWAVLHNSFGDENPIVSNGAIVNDEFYSEDLLWIQQLSHVEKGWVLNPRGYIIDLGWYPESDPKGSYCLALLRGDWNNVLLKFESKSRKKIRTAIERCLELIAQGVNDKDIERLIESGQPISDESQQ